ncbi:hypothetical protein J4558_22150 [Leptolyngbya sp. 15MV]|nr:hypothetical protein J4558_22150 [Leptolyngbya sp. 15MV]
MALARADWTRAAMLFDHALAHGAGRDPAVWASRSTVAQELGDAELAFDALAYAHALQPLRRDSAGALSAALAAKAERGGR